MLGIGLRIGEPRVVQGPWPDCIGAPDGPREDAPSGTPLVEPPRWLPGNDRGRSLTRYLEPAAVRHGSAVSPLVSALPAKLAPPLP
jgi:hypothetical protein